MQPISVASTRSTSQSPILMLFSRLVLFGLYQTLIFGGFAIAGTPDPWRASADWWPVSATLTNLTSFFLLRRLAAQEGITYSQLINLDFRREHMAKDMLPLLGALIVAGPVAMLPNTGFADLLFGDSQIAVDMLIRPLPMWGVLVSALFPITIAFGELPTYFAYAMPRLAARWKSPWAALVVSALMLGAQHMTLPLLFDFRFILWRLVMFIPFGLWLGIVIRWRPRLMPYFMIVHVLIDMSMVGLIWQASVA